MKQIKLLVIENHKKIAGQIKSHLKNKIENLDIDVAYSGQSAIKILNDRYFDIIISDIKMEEENSGIKVAKFVKELKNKTIVILYSSYERVLSTVEAADINVFDYFPRNLDGIDFLDYLVLKTTIAIRFCNLLTTLEIQNYFYPEIRNKLLDDPEMLKLGLSDYVTVAFIDISNFTDLTEKLLAYPHVIADYLTHFYNIILEQTFNHKGIVDKFHGDGGLIYFGGYNSGTPEENAYNACEAALSILGEFKQLCKTKSKILLQSGNKIQENDLEKYNLRIGLHTGQILNGEIPTKINKQITILGDTVNITCKICDIASKNQILISPRTYAFLETGSFICNSVDIKGRDDNKTGYTDCYELVGNLR